MNINCKYLFANDQNVDELISISTKDITSHDVAQDLINAEAKGNEILMYFVRDRDSQRIKLKVCLKEFQNKTPKHSPQCTSKQVS